MKISQFEVSKVRFLPYNPNRLSPGRIDALSSSHSRFGVLQPIVVNRREGREWPASGRGLYVVGGEHRLRVAKKLGMGSYPGVEVRVGPQEEQVMNLALNNAGDYDVKALGELLKDLQRAKANLDASGFGQAEIDLAIQEMEREMLGASAEDEVPPLPLKAKTRPGELIKLGRHRLLCGDAGDPNAVSRLIHGEGVHLVVTDPPYNVGTTSWTVPKGKSGRVSRGPRRPTHPPLKNDQCGDEEYAHKLKSWFASIARSLLKGKSFYIWGGYGTLFQYGTALKATPELFFSQAIIWVKEHPVLNRKDFMGNHEWCFYGWKVGGPHFKNKAIRNCTDVWSVKKVNPNKMVYLTEKPVELFRKAMLMSSRPGERVLDLFAGSGPTLMAAEQTERTAFLMEIDPRYCDVIRERWLSYGGKDGG